MQVSNRQLFHRNDIRKSNQKIVPRNDIFSRNYFLIGMCNYGMDSTIIEVVLPFAGEGEGEWKSFPVGCQNLCRTVQLQISFCLCGRFPNLKNHQLLRLISQFVESNVFSYRFLLFRTKMCRLSLFQNRRCSPYFK